MMGYGGSDVCTGHGLTAAQDKMIRRSLKNFVTGHPVDEWKPSGPPSIMLLVGTPGERPSFVFATDKWQLDWNSLVVFDTYNFYHLKWRGTYDWRNRTIFVPIPDMVENRKKGSLK